MAAIDVRVSGFRGPILWARFKVAARRRGFSVAEALAEAIEDWLGIHERAEDRADARREAGVDED